MSLVIVWRISAFASRTACSLHSASTYGRQAWLQNRHLHNRYNYYSDDSTNGNYSRHFGSPSSGFYISSSPIRAPLLSINPCCYQNLKSASIWGASKATEWNRAVSEAEKIVGYSTSFLSLRCLLSDELSNVAIQMRKLVGTGHPLLKTARKLFYDGSHSMQTRGLLLLLVAKAAGPSPSAADTDPNELMIGGIYPRQRTLAEIVEMIHTAGLIHRGIINISPFSTDHRVNPSPENASSENLAFGNKMAVLSGDFLLANASTGLAGLNNTQVVETISAAIGDMMRAEFTALRDRHGNAVVPETGLTIDDWENQSFLASGSLISRGCRATLMLAKHAESLQDAAFELGKQIAFAYQLNEELQHMANADETLNGFTVTSAACILYSDSPHCRFTPEELTKKNARQLAKLVLGDNVVLKEVRRLRNTYAQCALDTLEAFSHSNARNALQNIVQATFAV